MRCSPGPAGRGHAALQEPLCHAFAAHPASLALPGGAAAETGLVYFETSAKTNVNVTQLFEEVADK